jgi:hypothetical protein
MRLTVELDVPPEGLGAVVEALMPLCIEVKILGKPAPKQKEPPSTASAEAVDPFFENTVVFWLGRAVEEGKLEGDRTVEEVWQTLAGMGWPYSGDGVRMVGAGLRRALVAGKPWVSSPNITRGGDPLYRFHPVVQSSPTRSELPTVVDWLEYAVQRGGLRGGYTKGEVAAHLKTLGWKCAGEGHHTVRSGILRALRTGKPWISYNGKKKSRAHVYEFQLPEANGDSEG